MKHWNNPEIMELNLADTAHQYEGIYFDGGYIGDPGSGTLSNPIPGVTPNPVNPLS